MSTVFDQEDQYNWFQRGSDEDLQEEIEEAHFHQFPADKIEARFWMKAVVFHKSKKDS